MRISALAIALSFTTCAGAATMADAHTLDGKNRHVVIQNITNTTVESIYITRTDPSETWGQDTLRSNEVMLPSEQMNYNVDDGTDTCVFDFKVVFRGGAIRYGRVDVCVARVIDITATNVVMAS